MLPLRPFALEQPRTVDEALAALELAARQGESTKLLAGGTDLLPNLKHELGAPARVIALSRLPLTYVTRDEGALCIGALTTLDSVERDPLVREATPALAEAARAVGGPHHRRMGTLGGNVCLDTRCRFVNQSYFWRSALGYCLKKDGSVCHVVEGGQRCVAVQSSDTVPALIAHGASAVIRSARAERVVPLRSLYSADGAQHLTLAADELLVEVQVPCLAPREACAFEKLRVRAEIDFAAAHLAAFVRTDDGGAIEELFAVVGSVGPKPRVVAFEDARGRPLDASVVQSAAAHLTRRVTPLMQLDVDASWRRAMLGVLLRRALERMGSALHGPTAR